MMGAIAVPILQTLALYPIAAARCLPEERSLIIVIVREPKEAAHIHAKSEMLKGC